MSFPLKPRLAISHLLPGCFFLLLVTMGYVKWDFTEVKAIFSGLNSSEFIGTGIIALIAAFLFGEVADSLRDGILELFFERICKMRSVNWSYFYMQSDNEKLLRLEEYYFMWYIFNLNSATCLFFGGVITVVDLGWRGTPWFYVIVWIIVIAVLIYDSVILRNEIAEHTQNI